MVVPGRQAVLPWQQPVGHEVASQMQLPATQRRPDSQAGPAPHWQVPVAEHPSAVVESHATHVPPPLPHAAAEGDTQAPLAQQPLGHDCALHTHAPVTQTVPAAQAAPAPQAQAPAAVHVSVAAAAQGTHARPLTPQLAALGTRQGPVGPRGRGAGVNGSPDCRPRKIRLHRIPFPALLVRRPGLRVGGANMDDGVLW